MNKRASEILKEIKTHTASTYWEAPRVQLTLTPLITELQIVLAEEQTESAGKVEKQTNKLIYLTWAILIFTAVLAAFTIALYEDAHAQINHDRLSGQHEAQKP